MVHKVVHLIGDDSLDPSGLKHRRDTVDDLHWLMLLIRLCTKLALSPHYPTALLFIHSLDEAVSLVEAQLTSTT